MPKTNRKEVGDRIEQLKISFKYLFEERKFNKAILKFKEYEATIKALNTGPKQYYIDLHIRALYIECLSQVGEYGQAKEQIVIYTKSMLEVQKVHSIA